MSARAQIRITMDLDGANRASAIGERVGLYAKSLQHRYEEIRKRHVFVNRFFLPWFSTTGPSAAGRLFRSIIQILAVLEPHVPAAGQNEWIVARKVKRAGRRSKQQQRVVQHRSITA